MAFGKIAGCLILAANLWPAEFAVRHEHTRKGCSGTMSVDGAGIRFTGPKHSWTWRYADIQQLTLAPGRVHILSYKDSKLRLGADVAYTFTGEIPVEQLYAQWRATLDQRFVAAVESPAGGKNGIPAKRVGLFKGSVGLLTIAPESVIYAAPGDSRTWRYSDIQFVSSSSPFQLTITTFEKQFNFQLKEPMAESRYNQLWLDIEKKNGRIQ